MVLNGNYHSYLSVVSNAVIETLMLLLLSLHRFKESNYKLLLGILFPISVVL